MKIAFRQGLVSYQKDGLNQPQFLQASTTSGYVAFDVSPTPTVVTFAHGGSNYLQVFDVDVPAAWGPLQPGVTNYLWWDIDILTAEVTFKISLVEPINSFVEPANPVFDQHWFDMNTTTMKVWNGSKWLPRIRVLAGRVPSGSISLLVSATTGSQVGLNGEVEAGYVMLDYLLKPLRTSVGEFLTSKAPVHIKATSGTSGILAVPPNAFIPIRASEPIPRFSLVYFSGEDTVGLASSNPALTIPKTPIGIVQEDLSADEVGVVTQSGEISWDQWDWSAHMGQAMYCGFNGEVTPVRPSGILAYRVGFVKNRTTILFQVDAETQPQIYQVGPTDVIVSGIPPITSTFSLSGLNEKVWTLSMPIATSTVDGYMPAVKVAQLDDVDTRLGVAEIDILNRALLNHTHVIANVTGLQAALDGKSNVGHTHIISEVTNLQTELNNRSLVGHTHIIADVTGLASALALKSNVGHTHVAAEVTDFAEAVDDRVAALLVAGTNVTLAYNDAANSLTINAAGGSSYTPSLLSVNVNLVAPVTGIVGNFSSGQMTYLTQYVAAYPLAVPTNETQYNTSNILATTSFANSRTVTFGSRPRSVIGSTLLDANVGWRVYEFLVNVPVNTTTAQHSVGFFTQAFGPAFNPGSERGGPLSAGYDSNGTITSPGTGNVAAPSYTTGDYIGVVIGDPSGQIHFFKNGVFAGSALRANNTGYAYASRLDFAV